MMNDTTANNLDVIAYQDGKIVCEYQLSPAVLLFAKEMQVKLNAHRDSRDDTYKELSYSELYNALKDEVNELLQALIDSDHENSVSEAADVANFAMFIALNSTRTSHA